MKKRIVGFLVVMLTVFILPIAAKADDTKFKDDKCIVPFELYITYDGNEKYLRSSYGVLVGLDNDGGAKNMIVNANDVQATAEEYQIAYDEYEIEENRRDRVGTTVKVIVEKDIKIEATINNVSNSMNLAVLNLSETVFNHNSVLVDIDEENIKPAQELYVLDTESNYHVVYAVNESMINGIKYIQFDSALDSEQKGQALFNENEEFVGMVQDSVDGIHKNALSSKEIVVVLKTLGVNIDVADHTIKPIDKQILITATDMADKLDLTMYTEETATAMSEQIQNARSVIIRDDVTQEEVDLAYETLTAAQDALVVDEKLDTITIVFIIVSGVLVLGIIIFIIVMIIIKKRKKKKEQEKAILDAKRAPVSNGPYVPSSNKKKKEKEEISGKSEYLTRVKINADSGRISEPSGNVNAKSEKLAQLEGFAPSSKSINFNEEDTTVLSAIAEETPVASNTIYAHLMIKNSDKRIDVTKETFVLGKSDQKADYAIESKSVSRAHLSIIHRNGQFFAMDMSSLNGSYVNDVKLNPQEEVAIKNEDVIKLADVELVFCTE